MVNAYNDGNPSCFGQTPLLITVTRNNNGPVFDSGLYTAFVTVNTPIYETLVNVNASDPVDGVSYFHINKS